MGKTERAVIGIFAFMLLVAADVARSQVALWKGKIETENGVKVIKNPTTPLYGDFAFDLQEDLVIGGDPTKENAYFPKGAVLSVDEDGDFFVCDFGNRRVQMFDRQGAFLRSIGRQGQGPGEYTFPTRVLFDAEGNPCVWAARDVLHYGKDGLFKNKISLKTFLNNSMFGPGGTIIGTTQPGRSPDGPKHTLVQLDPDGNPLRIIAEYRGEFQKDQIAIREHWYSNFLAFASLSNQEFVYGFPEDYRFYVAGADGRTRLAVTIDEKPIPISRREKDETIKNGAFSSIGTNDRTIKEDDFPDHRPFYGRLFTDASGRVYVARSRSIFEKDKPAFIDVFSKDGYFLYKMEWRLFPSVIQGGYFYAVRQDKESGETQVVRFKIKNWGEMKNGL